MVVPGRRALGASKAPNTVPPIKGSTSGLKCLPKARLYVSKDHSIVMMLRAAKLISMVEMAMRSPTNPWRARRDGENDKGCVLGGRNGKKGGSKGLQNLQDLPP